MKKENQKKLGITIGCFLLFIVWTIAICTIDRQAIGPKNSVVGFAAFNGFFHELTGTHMMLYHITDWLGLVPVFVALGFAVLGLVQLIKRRSLCKVDSDILVLGGFYILVVGAYLLFEMYAVNYRPVLIEGYLEASYPSSTTLLVLCVMPTAVMQFQKRIQNEIIKRVVMYSIFVFIVFMVGGRLLAGVHWFTDIVGGIFLSAGLVGLYVTANEFKGCNIS